MIRRTHSVFLCASVFGDRASFVPHKMQPKRATMPHQRVVKPIIDRAVCSVFHAGCDSAIPRLSSPATAYQIVQHHPGSCGWTPK